MQFSFKSFVEYVFLRNVRLQISSYVLIANSFFQFTQLIKSKLNKAILAGVLNHAIKTIYLVHYILSVLKLASLCSNEMEEL